MALQSQKLATIEGRVKLASDTIKQMGGQYGDTVYLGIGHGYPWPQNDTLVPVPVDSVDYKNQVHRDLVAIKKLSVSTSSLVVQRNDWVANTFIYDPMREDQEMYSTLSIETANGYANVSNSNIVRGTAVGNNQSSFTQDFLPGDHIVFLGDGITTLPVTKEIINIANDHVLTVNSNVSGNYVLSAMQNVEDVSPQFARNFYVRNIYDQVFICLDNNNDTISSDMPSISLGGDLPSSPYVITDDGYKWKYLYTIASGYKKLFFTSQWMPVILDSTAIGSAVDGRIDIVDITNGGQGYNANNAACSAPILVLTGDGTGANVSATVDSNGTITAVNILGGGSGYTQANITANTGANGAGFSCNVVIGARGGWGSNAALELGATTLMISTSLANDENGTIPIEDVNGEFFTYRQLSLILNPTLALYGNTATNTNYDMSTTIQVSPLSNNIFQMGDIAYQNFNTGTLQGATWFGTVVWYDTASQELHLNNIGGTGSFQAQSPIKGIKRGAATNTASYITATAFTLTPSMINTFSGTDLYIENTLPIQRYPLQTEEIRLIISF